MTTSNTHQLRVINRNCSGKDIFTYQSNPRESDSHAIVDSTITNSQCIHETDIHLLNFSCIPGSVAFGPAVTVPTSSVTSSSNTQDFKSSSFPQPHSASNSVSSFNLIVPSSLSSVSTSRQIEQLNKWWTGYIQVSTKSRSVKIFSRKSNVPKLTHVDLKVVSKTHHNPVVRTQQSSAEQKYKELIHLRKQVKEKLTHSSQKKRNMFNGLDDKEIATNLDIKEETRSTERMEIISLENLKLSVTANLEGDKIMLQLKEKLKQQRALAISLSPGHHGITTTILWPERHEFIEKDLGILTKDKDKSSGESKLGHGTKKVHTANSASENENTCNSQQFDDEVAHAFDNEVVDNSYGEIKNNLKDSIIDKVTLNVKTLSKNARDILSELKQGEEYF